MEIAQKVGPFRVISHIAKGGMGDVYLARHEEKDRLVAIKILPKEFLKDRKRSQYLEREVKIARKLSHPSVVDIYGLHREDGIGYLIMEYLDGGSLRKHIKNRDLSLAEILEITLRICDGLHYIHNHKLEDDRFHSIIHRDIKPENILLSKNGRIKVADFGLSLSEGGWSRRKTKSRAGTPLYMSPEQVRGQPLDIRTDIYSLGLVLYELLTGQLPYKAQEREMYMKMTISKKVKPAPPSYVRKEIPKEFDSIVLRALEKKPGERYQTVAEMILDLRRLAPGLMPDDLAEGFQFMRDVRVAKSTQSSAEDSAQGPGDEIYGASETTPDDERSSESSGAEPISDDGQSDGSDSDPDDADRLRRELLQLHREMLYVDDPEKARAVRTADPGKSVEILRDLAAEDQIEGPCEEAAVELAADLLDEIDAEADHDKSEAAPEPEALEASVEAGEPETKESKVEEPELEEPEAEFLPGAGAENDLGPHEPEGSEPAPAALGQNSGIVDGELVDEFGDDEAAVPEEDDQAGATISEEAAFDDSPEEMNGSDKRADTQVEEEIKPALRLDANSSNGNGKSADTELSPIRSDDGSAHEGFGSLDTGEIEGFIFIGRKKG